MLLLIILLFFGKDMMEKITHVFINDYYLMYGRETSNSVLDTTSKVGDTYGGTLGPVLALIASFLTFIAFWAQFLANKEVQKQFKVQQFESQFFEMIRLHKENINEMQIMGYDKIVEKTYSNGNIVVNERYSQRLVEGRKVFVSMSKELIACFRLCKDLDVSNKYSNQDLLELSYKFFFFGSESNLISSQAVDKEFIIKVKKKLKIVRDIHKASFGTENRFKSRRGRSISVYIKYAPFTGHENRLGHYYRNLYSTVKFVVKHEEEGLFSYSKAREYLKLLRSQMSNYEQLMLYYNYIIGFGAEWENDHNFFFSKYRMLHNLPVDRVQFVAKPRHHFRIQIENIKKSTNGNEQMFEWGDFDS